jgi:hypothetical protein
MFLALLQIFKIKFCLSRFIREKIIPLPKNLEGAKRVKNQSSSKQIILSGFANSKNVFSTFANFQNQILFVSLHL